MSEENGEENIDDLAEGLEQKKFSGKKLVLFVVLPLLLLLIGGGVALMFLGGDDPEVAEGEHGAEQAELHEENPDEPTELLFLDLEPLLVNLSTAGGKPSYLKLTIALEVDRQSSLDDLQAKLPRVIDNFQIYLRELRVEDLNGSAGMFRLKEELLIRVNEAVYPTRVHDVLFKEILING
ncbi:flagellar basal body-associated FliL family protein [Emcibacter sp.]|uniref:flagellar basal body-associated FliL family protein n=1 Tax=Emcibacter sp. TaxID=1979954 RepID=UPI003A9444A3